MTRNRVKFTATSPGYKNNENKAINHLDMTAVKEESTFNEFTAIQK